MSQAEKFVWAFLLAGLVFVLGYGACLMHADPWPREQNAAAAGPRVPMQSPPPAPLPAENSSARGWMTTISST